MEIACIGFLGGVVFAIIFIGIVLNSSEEPHEHNSDSDSDVPSGDRSRSSDNGTDKRVETEEMKIVLEYFRLGATLYEKKVIDAITERIENEA